MVSRKEIRDYFAKFGRRGGKTRAGKMTAERRKEIARKAAQPAGRKSGRLKNPRGDS
jgi:hypothetical protein